MFKKIGFIAALALGFGGAAFGSTCNNTCTVTSGTVSSGSDTSALGSMESANPSITFTNITFGGSANDSATGYTDPTTGVYFTGADAANPDLHLFSSLGTWPNGGVLGVSSGSGNITATLPANVYSVAFDLLSTFGSVAQFEVIINNGASYDVGTYSDSALPGSGFFGVVSTTPITSIEIQAYNSSTWGIDDFEVGTEAGQSQTPEVATMIIIGIGLLFIRELRRRRPGMLA